MTHLRIRKSNTKDGYLMPGLKYGASQVVVAHDQIFVLGQTGLTLDNKGFVGEGNPAQQAENAMLNVKMLLEESGATMNDICKIIPYTTKRSYRHEVYPVISKYLEGVNPVSTGIVVKSLAKPYLDFEIDVWAVLPKNPDDQHKRLSMVNARNGYLMPDLKFQNARVIKANDNIFLQGQTGLSLNGNQFIGEGNPALQTETAMKNIVELLSEIDSSLEDVCKITVYITDISYRSQVYPVIAKYFGNIAPVSTGVVVKGLARKELDVEIDVFACSSSGKQHQRYFESKPNYLPELDFPLSKVVKAGKSIFLQGQTGLSLENGKLIGKGDPKLQAEVAMQNVKSLLARVNSNVKDICKIITYVKDQDTRDIVYPVIAKHLDDVYPASTGLVIESLASEELDFEIDVFAVES